MKQLILNTFFSIVLLSSASIAAQDVPATDDSKQAVSKPYEIVITPTVTRSNLRTLIIQVEEDFFAKFNELNIDDAYDIYCYEYTPIMSHISKRACEPVFMLSARGLNASEAMFNLGSSGVDGRTAAIALLSPGMMRKDMNKEYETLQEKMEELNRTDVEFNSIGSALAQLKARLENFGKE